MSTRSRDHYVVLGVSRAATPEEIKRAYRTRAAASHPDRNPDDAGAADRFKEVAEAYAVLSDPALRAQYDRGDDAGLLGASAAREIATREVLRTIVDGLHHHTPGGEP